MTNTDPIKALVDLGPELERLMSAATATPWGNRGKLSDRIVGPDEKTIAEFVSQTLGKNGDEQDEANAVFCTFIVNNTQTILAAIEALTPMASGTSVVVPLYDLQKIILTIFNGSDPLDERSGARKSYDNLRSILAASPSASTGKDGVAEAVKAAKIEAFDEALSIAEGSYSYGEQQNEIIAGIRAAIEAIKEGE